MNTPEHARELLLLWVAYYDGKGSSAGLRQRTEEWLKAETAQYRDLTKPYIPETPEEVERMSQ